MEACIWMALAATFGTWLVTALGAATVVFFSSPKEKTLNLMLGFSAGVMIAASFWSLLEPAIAQAERLPGLPAWLVATAGFLIGALFLWGSDKLVSRALGQVEAGGKKRVILLVLSITLHNIPEGLAVGVAFGALQNGYSPEALMGAVSVAVGRIFPRVRRCLCLCAGKGAAGAEAFSSARPQPWWNRWQGFWAPGWLLMCSGCCPMPCPLRREP